MPPPIVSVRVEALPWAELCLAGVAFACGAALGSFLNVVAYRIPRGESPVMGGSRCPACGRGILPRDNVPVLGWLLLRGRCRTCHAAIPRRYVLVEAACGGLLGTLAAARLACDPHGLDRLLVHGDLRPLLVFGGQAALLMTLVAWSLLADRGHRVVRATRWLAMAVAVGSSVLGAVLDVEPLKTDASPWPWLGPLLDSLVGGVCGWLAGCLVRRLASRAVIGADDVSIVDRDMLTLVGLAAGWQPVVLVAAVTVMFRVVAPGTPLARHVIPPATLLAVMACGRWLDGPAGFHGWLR